MPGLIDMLATVVRRARFYLNRERFERELAEEMAFHVEMKARDHAQGGMSASDAEWAARRRFGNATRIKDETGDVMSVGWVEAAIQDARYTLHSLRQSPVFSAVAIVSLALGIGATTAVFTLVNAMLLRPLPFPDAGRLVLAFQTITPGVFFPVDSMPWSYNKYRRLRELVPAFAGAGYSSWEEYNLRRTGPETGSEAEPAARVRAELVTTNLFSTLGAPALLGRTITVADSSPSVTGAVVVLSEPLWRRHFNADSRVIGATAVLDEMPVTIIGVMPASFTGIRENAEMWVPIEAVGALDTPRRRQQMAGGMGTVVARLAPNATLATADAQLKTAARTLNTVFPPPAFGPRKATWSGGAVGFAEARRHPLVRPLLLVLSIAVAGVLVIVCANLAGLLLARARAREAELGVRIALGAGRGRLVRQLLTESVVLAVLGATPGIAIAYGGAVALARLRPTLPPNYTLLRSVDLLQGASLAPDWRVLTFAIAITLVVGVVFGAAPAFAASRTNIADLIRVAANRGATTRSRGRRALVIGQIALATTLLVGAGLMVRSFRALLASDIGFVPDHLVKLRIAGGDSASSTPARREEMLARIAALPGMESAAAMNCAPFESDCVLMPVTKIDVRAVERDEYPPIEVHSVSRDLLRTLRIPLRLGRPFDAREAPGEPTAVILNESAARLLWNGESPIGRRLSTFQDGQPQVEVIGVVADVKYEAIDAPARPAVYYDAAQFGASGGSVIFARSRGDAAASLPAIRRVIAESNPALAIHGVATGEEMLARAASSTRFVTALLSSFGAVAALLAALGVYGVLAYLVSQRKREFGVRMAIGALPSSLLGLVFRQGLVLTIGGLVVGVAGAMAASRLLSTFLYGVGRSDALTYAVIVAIVGAAGLVATLIPARRATQVDPVIALRQ
jgi:predicted permease